MKILITGGTGFLGSAFIREYPRHQYTVLTRSVRNARKYLPAATNYISDLEQVGDIGHFDVVINLAGEPIADKRWSARQKKILCESRWGITRSLVDMIKAAEKPPRLLISGSAIGIYGDTRDDAVTEQTNLPSSGFATEMCQKWESIAQEANGQTRVVLLRTGVVLGRKGGALKKMWLPFKLGLGGRIGCGSQYMSWIHLSDWIRAVDFIVRQDDFCGPVNLTAPNPVTNSEFTQILAKCMHRPAMIPVPSRLLSKLMGESSSLLLDSNRVQPEALQKAGFDFQFASLSHALNHIVS